MNSFFSLAQSLLIMWQTMFKNLIGKKLKLNEQNISNCSSKLLTLFCARVCCGIQEMTADFELSIGEE